MSGGRRRPGSHRTSRPDRRYSDASTRSEPDTFTTRSGRASASVERVSSTNTTGISDASVDAAPAPSQPLPYRPSSKEASVRSPGPVRGIPQLSSGSGPAARAAPHQRHRMRASADTTHSGGDGSGEDLAASMAVCPGTPPPSQAPPRPPGQPPTKPKREIVDAETDKRKAATMHDKKKKGRPGPEPDAILPWRQDSRDNFPARDDILGGHRARRLEDLGLLGSPGPRMVSAYPPEINDVDIYDQDDEGNQGGQPGRQEEDGDWDMCD